MESTQATVPAVFGCIAKVSAEIAQTGISKSRNNQQQGYKFRGIDDVYNALAPLIAKHGLVIVPRILRRELVERQTKSGGVLFNVTVEAEFDFVAVSDGSKVTARSFGEAMDAADKATNKAMSAAYKYTAFQTFCIPTEGDNDADAHTPEATAAWTTPPPARTERPTAPPPLTREDVPPGLRVTNAKVAKQGQSAKGPWTLYVVKFSDGREGKTFSKPLYEAADDACKSGQIVDVDIAPNGDLIGMTAVFPLESELA